MSCARLAERVVALICCEKLHKIGKTWKNNLFVKVYFIVEKYGCCICTSPSPVAIYCSLLLLALFCDVVMHFLI